MPAVAGRLHGNRPRTTGKFNPIIKVAY